MFSCIFDPGACIAAGWTNLLASIPWWAWIITALVIVGVVWKFAGWPGLIALAFGIGYFARDLMRAYNSVRTHEPIESVDGDDAAPPPKKTKKKRKTLEDLFRDGLK